MLVKFDGSPVGPRRGRASPVTLFVRSPANGKQEERRSPPGRAWDLHPEGKRDRMNLRVHRVNQSASGGSFVVSYEATIELRTDNPRIEVHILATDPPEEHDDEAVVQLAENAIRRGAEHALSPRGLGAKIRVSNIVIHPVDYKPRMYEFFTAFALEELLGREEASETSSEAGAKGRGRFVLGFDSEGAFGHVELVVRVVPNPGHHAVVWQVERPDLPSDARTRTEIYIARNVAAYAARQQVGLEVTITEVTSDPVRRNDYERAANIALRDALERLSLPVPQIFGL